VLKYDVDSLQFSLCDGNGSSCQNVNAGCTKSKEFPNCWKTYVYGPDLFSEPEEAMTPPASVFFPLNMTYYAIFFESLDNRNCFGTAVAVEGGVVGDRKIYQKADSGADCAAETSCLLDPPSSHCTAVIGGQVDTAQTLVKYTATGSIQLCDTSNEEVGEDLCVLDPPPCDESSVYTSCTYALITGEELKAMPSILVNDDPPEESNDAIYIIYYTNEACTQFGAMRG
jgi:hypothetical protein